MPNKDELFSMLKDILEQDFEIAGDSIALETNLYEELDLDSIDAVDLVVKLRERTGKKMDPNAFKQVRTIEDVVNALDKLFQQ